MLDTKQRVADIVSEHSSCAEVFQRYRIDFCCGGKVSLEEAALKKGADLDALVVELETAIEARRAQGDRDPREMPTEELVDHIVSTHHAYLRSTLPFVRGLAEKVARVHGDREPRLRSVDALVGMLEGRLLPHLDDEEERIFPALSSPAAGEEPAPLLREMIGDHEEVGGLLAKLRDLTDDFTPPEWACGSYRTLFAELKEMQRDIHVHVHIENNVLAPRFLSN